MIRNTHPPGTPQPGRRVDELEQSIRRVERKRKIYSLIVLTPLVAALVISSIYTFMPAAGPPAAEPADALAELEAVVREHPRDLEALVALGNRYYDKARYADAEKTYLQALAIDPVAPEVRTDYGTSLLYQNRPLEAIAAYRKALETHPRQLNSRVNLGVAYQAIGQADKAAAEWHDALALNEDPAVEQRIKDLLAGLRKPK